MNLHDRAPYDFYFNFFLYTKQHHFWFRMNFIISTEIIRKSRIQKKKTEEERILCRPFTMVGVSLFVASCFFF